MRIPFYNEACARCDVPFDIHRQTAVPAAQDLPHTVWGDLNRCLEFAPCVPPRAAYGALPACAPAPTALPSDRRQLFVELLADLRELRELRLAPMGSQVADRQTFALALAELSLRRPGWLEYLREMAGRYLGSDREFQAFRQTSVDVIEPEAAR